MPLETPARLEFVASARALFAHEVGAERSSERVAEAAVRVWETLGRHLARIVGEDGIHTILVRSVIVASGTFPWLAEEGAPADRPWAHLRTAMERQDRDVIADAFVALLAAVSTLLGRLIGEGLVARLLCEVWPAFFLQGTSRGPS